MRSDHFLYQQTLREYAGTSVNLHKYHRPEIAATVFEYLMWLGEEHPHLQFSAQDLRVLALRSCLNETHPADVAEDMDLPVNDALNHWVMTG